MDEKTQRPSHQLSDGSSIPAELSSAELALSAGEAEPLPEPNDGEQALAPAVEHDIGDHGAEFSRHVHSYLSTYVSLADQKAAFVFAFAVALLGLVYKGAGTELLLQPCREWTFLSFVSLTSALTLFACLAFSAATILPRLKGDTSGLVYWGGIVKHPAPADYVRIVEESDARRLTAELSRHCHELSAVCDSKYRSLRWATITGVAGALASVLFLLLA